MVLVLVGTDAEPAANAVAERFVVVSGSRPGVGAVVGLYRRVSIGWPPNVQRGLTCDVLGR